MSRAKAEEAPVARRGRSAVCCQAVRFLRRRSYALSDVGRRREGNEDAFVADDTLGLYVVADGVGGQAKGEVASAEACEHVRNFVRTSFGTVNAYLEAHDDQSLYALRRMLESAV